MSARSARASLERGGLADRLLLVVAFADHVNTLHAEMLCRSGAASVREVLDVVAPGGDHAFAAEVEKPALTRGFTYALARAGIAVVFDEEVAAFCRRFAEQLLPDAGSPLEQELPVPDPQGLARSRDIGGPVYVYEALNHVAVASCDLGGARFRADSIVLSRTPELLDPVSMAHEYLVTEAGIPVSLVDHHVQRWIKETFDLRHDHRLRFALAHLTRRLNRLFYGSATPSSRTAHASGSHSVAAALVIEETCHALEEAAPDSEDEPAASPAPFLQAVGLYLILKFARILRSEFVWVEGADLERFQVCSNEGSERSAMAEDPNLLEQARLPHRTLMALHPVEYTYFKIRTFGALTGLPGLNSILRGGILPYCDRGQTLLVQGPPGSGKTIFSLQLMTDIASRGRLAVYLALEEGYSDLLDRLVTFGLNDDRFDVITGGLSKLASAIGRYAHRPDHEKGLLFFYHPESGETTTGAAGTPAKSGARTQRGGQLSIEHVLGRIAALSESVPRFRWRAIAVDSIAPLRLTDGDVSQRDERLATLRLLEAISNQRFLGVLVSLEGGRKPAFSDLLPGLADTVVRLGSDAHGTRRTLQIEKCRGQNFQPGVHPFRIRDGRGIKIYPSLSAVRSRLSRRGRSLLDPESGVPFPPQIARDLDVGGIPLNASALFVGPAGTGKTALALNLAVSHTWTIRAQGDARAEDSPARLVPARSIMYVSFRTSESRFRQTLSNHLQLQARWQRIPRRRVRWFAPGQNISSAQFLDYIWSEILSARREAVRLERIVFDELETACHALPALAEDPMVWNALVDLVSTEGITALFVAGEDADGTCAAPLGELVDFAFRTFRAPSATSFGIEVARRPRLDAPRTRRQAFFCVGPSGLLEPAAHSSPD